MGKRAASVCTTVAAVVVTGLALAAPAGATSSVDLYWNGYLRATGGFSSTENYGNESFHVCDMRADGYGVNLYWYVVSNPSNSGKVRDGDGANNGCGWQYVNIGEGKTVKYQVCLTDNNEDIYCMSWTGDVA